MKKQLLMGAIALTMAVSSCQKEKSDITAKATNEAGKLKVNTLPQPTYVDLELVPRKPGENYDTYHATYHGSSVYIIGPAIYDQSKYPTLVNGVPAFGQSMYADNGASIDYQNTGTDGNVFQVTQTLFSYTDHSIINTDLGNYFKAVDTYNKNPTGNQPSIFNYVKTDYKSSSAASVLIFTGKVIRVTTGSHWGLAEINYPLPTATTYPYAGPAVYQVTDPLNSHITYLLSGSHGIYTQASVGYDANYSSGTQTTASVTSIHVTIGTGIYHFVGTIVRTDGTLLRVDVVVDVS